MKTTKTFSHDSQSPGYGFNLGLTTYKTEVNPLRCNKHKKTTKKIPSSGMCQLCTVAVHYHRFTRIRCLSLQGSVFFFTLKMYAAGSFETLIPIYQTIGATSYKTII
jgi:hypothetical protein